jgi:hypothetical protein
LPEFWTARFLPWCEELTAQDRPRFKPDTLRGYRQISQQHLAGNFGELTLRQYTPDLGTVFLDRLTARLSWAQSLFKRVGRIQSLA